MEEIFNLIGLIQCKDSRKVASALFAMPNLFIMSDNKSARGLPIFLLIKNFYGKQMHIKAFKKC
jgi:hypothetical protein